MSLFSIINGTKMKMLQGIPGPTPHFPLGNAGDFLNGRPWQACARYGREYGGLTLAWTLNNPVLVLNDPDLVAEVLIERTNDFYKDQPVAALTPVITNKTPFVLNGAAWAAAREQAPFSQSWFPEWLQERIAVVYDYVLGQAGQLRAMGETDSYKAIQRLTFDAFSMAALGTTLGDRGYDPFMEMACTGNVRIKSALPVLPPPIRPSFYKAYKKWYSLFRDIVGEMWQNPDDNATDLVNTVRRHGTTLSPDDLSISVANIFYGGVFSAASGITNTLFHLARNPEIRGKLIEEASAAEGLNADALDSMSYLDCCLLESLRILPPVPFFSRNSRKDATITFAGHTIPKNTAFFISNWFLHHDGDHYHDPQGYNPSRWTPEFKAANPLGSGYFYPFGRGPRTCLGMPFAMMQMKTILAALLKEVHLEIGASQAYCEGFFFGVMVPYKLMGKFVNNI